MGLHSRHRASDSRSRREHLGNQGWHPCPPLHPPVSLTFWMTSSSQLDRSMEGVFLARSICWEFRMLLTSSDIPSLSSLGIYRGPKQGAGFHGL